MYRRPAYAFGLLYDVFYCRCVSEIEHKVTKCTKKKTSDRAHLLNKTTKACFGPEALSYDPRWSSINGLHRVQRNKALKQILIQGPNLDDSVNLAAFLMSWDPYMWEVFHQPAWVIRRYIKDTAENYWTNPSIASIIDERAARGWNLIMDVLSDKEVFTKVVGPLTCRDHERQYLSYKYRGHPQALVINYSIRQEGKFRCMPHMPKRPSMHAQPGALSLAEVRRMHNRSSGKSSENLDTFPKRQPSIYNRTGTVRIRFDVTLLMIEH